jgi:hypothetical protein
MPEYGASNLSVWDKIRLVQEWYPVVTFVQAVLATPDHHAKAVVVADACEWVASKTQTKVDDELVGHLTAILRSPQGESLLRWVMAKINEGVK